MSEHTSEETRSRSLTEDQRRELLDLITSGSWRVVGG
jgi:hypothetical protein